MTSNKQYKFSNSNGYYIIFDANGYILEAKGFNFIMWTSSKNIDKDLIGKHIDDLSDRLKNYSANRDVYYNFEIEVHIPLLKLILEDLKENSR